MWVVPKETKSVKLLRANAIEVIITVIKNAFEMNISSHETFVHIDEIIDSYELIGLFDEGELRKIIVGKLEEDINERKEEIH